MSLDDINLPPHIIETTRQALNDVLAVWGGERSLKSHMLAVTAVWPELAGALDALVLAVHGIHEAGSQAFVDRLRAAIDAEPAVCPHGHPQTADCAVCGQLPLPNEGGAT